MSRVYRITAFYYLTAVLIIVFLGDNSVVAV